MADRIRLHPDNPPQKRVYDVVDRLRNGAVVLLPTDTQYALACHYANKKGIDRIRSIRSLPRDHHFTLLVDSLNGVSTFAQLNDSNFKIIRRLIPGPFTFILPGTRQVPKLLVHPKRKTIGIKVPDHVICQKIVEELGEPLMVTTARLPGKDNSDYLDTTDLFEDFRNFVDFFVDDELPLTTSATTVVDLTGPTIRIMRKGMGLEALQFALDYSDIEYDNDL